MWTVNLIGCLIALLRSSVDLAEPALERPYKKVEKKSWERPVARVLQISRDTFSGSVTGIEAAGKSGLPVKK